MDGQKAFWTYTFATHFVDGQVFEEYMVEGGQIVYERYGAPEASEVEYYYVNCVPGGTRPVLEESHLGAEYVNKPSDI
jgi:hypothetical protein